MPEKNGTKSITVFRHESAGDCAEPLLHWFSQAADLAWKSAKSFFVLIPHPSVSLWIKRELLDKGQSFLGVRFITPQDARHLLARHLLGSDRICADAEMDILAASAALAESDPKSRSIAADPSTLRTLLETLTPTGHDLSGIFARYDLKPLYQNFQKALRRNGSLTPWAADRKFVECPVREPWIASLLVFGFHGGHWPLRHLLQAMMAHAEKCDLYLEEPRSDDEAAQLDRAWIDTWQEFSGQPEKIVFPQPSEKSREDFFVVGRDATEQAEGVAAMVAEWLKDGARRIGVLVPQKGFLSDEIAREFLRRGFSFYDGIASLGHGESENAEWRAWLEFQGRPSLTTCIAFLKERGEETGAIEREFDRAWRNVLTDDLTVILQWLDQERHGLRISLSLLPETADIAGMCAATKAAFKALGWEDRIKRVRSRAVLLEKNAKAKIDRHNWCHWLAKILDSSFREREKNAAEPYARLHLLHYEAALSQGWTHLVFAGMNEGEEPGSELSFPFLDAEDATRLNEEIRRRNRASTATGVQGMGSEIVPEGHAYCLGSEEKRQVGKRALVSLGEIAVCCYAASLHSESKASLQLRPSNFFADAWQESNKCVLSDDDFRVLENTTRNWLADCRFPQPVHDIPEIAEARNARTDASKSFGRYEFAFENTAPPEKAVLSCDAWEKAYNDPAAKWLEYYLGVKPLPTFEEVPWNMVVGEWTHWWMDAIHSETTRWETLPDTAERLSRIDAAAARFRDSIGQVYKNAGKTLPFWWEEALKQSLAIAYGLNKKLDALSRNWKFTTEYLASHPVMVKTDGEKSLRLNGRMDFIAAENLETEQLENASAVTIIDYKTGRSKPLSVSSLKKGEGVQVAFYALLVQALGVREVQAGYLVSEHPYVPAQVTLADLDAIREILGVLATMQDSGVFGMRREVRSEYARALPLPMATLRIADEILRSKWHLTHKAVSDE